MLRFCCAFIASVLVSGAVAQKEPVKYGSVSLEELKMTSYAPDTSAAAVVLADYGVSRIEYNTSTGWELMFDRVRRIKVLKKEGTEWADFTIRLYHSGDRDESVGAIKGTTYNLEAGKVVESKLKNDGIFKEKQDANTNLVKITLPNVREGSVIEYTYKVRSEFLFNFQDWDFQEEIPVAWSEYRALIPEYFNYEKYTQGYLSMFINEQNTSMGLISLSSANRVAGPGGTTLTQGFNQQNVEYTQVHYRWVVKDAPAFKSEPYMTTHRDYISRINFELAFTKSSTGQVERYMGTWEDVNKTYSEDEDFGGAVTGNGLFLKKPAEEIAAGRSTNEEKIAAIVGYVKENVQWDGRTRKFVDKPLRKVLEEKKGSSAEINLLTASMLQKVGLDVSPVLVSTRDNGFVREHIPVSSQFNAVVCLVRWEGKKVLLDATESFLPVGYLPSRYLNGKGLLISKKGFEWIKLDPPAKTRSSTNADLILAGTGELTGNLKIDHGGYEALEKRKAYFTKGETEYIKDLLKGKSWDLKKSEFQNAKEIQQEFREIHDVLIAEHVTSAGDVMYINPYLLNQQTANPFKAEKREYPVDFGTPFDRVYIAKIVIPEGYQVEESPVNKMLTLPGNAARYLTSVNIAGDVLTYTGMLSINRSIFTSEEYPHLREFFNQVVAKQNEQIVIKKK